MSGAFTQLAGLGLWRLLRGRGRPEPPEARFRRSWSLPVPMGAVVSPAFGPSLHGGLQIVDSSLAELPQLSLGWFVTAPGSGYDAPRLAEGRVTPRREGPHDLSFHLPIAEIAREVPLGRGMLWFDLVVDGAFWFFDREGKPAGLRLESPPFGGRAGALAEAWLAQAKPRELAQLAAEAAWLDLASPLAAARERAALFPPAASRLAPWAGEPRPGRRDPTAGALAQLASGGPAELDPAAHGLPTARLKRAILEGAGWPGGIAGEELAYFQRMRLQHRDSGAPLTAAMQDALALMPLAELPRILASPEAAREWWLFEVVLPCHLPLEALPPAHLAHWRGTESDDGSPPLSAYVWAAAARAGVALHPAGAGEGPARLALLFRHVLREFRDPRAAALTGPEPMGLLRRRLHGEGLAPTLFQVLLALALSAPGSRAPDAEPAFATLLEEAARLVREELPHLTSLLDPGGEATGQPLLIAGHHNASGLGENFRMFAASLSRLGLAARAFEVEEGHALTLDARGQLVEVARRPGPHRLRLYGRSLPRPTSLFAVNPERVAMLALRQDFAALFERRRIGFFLTETQSIAPELAAVCDRMDEIWTPSEFVRASYAAHTATPVYNVGKALQWPTDVPDPYPAFLPERADRFVFLVSFDPSSWLRRKNPTAAVSAFLAAFPSGREPVSLVIKVPVLPRALDGDPFDEWSLIEQAAARDPRIVIREAYSSFLEYLGYIAHADCVISPHRSEGFGYLCAQAHHFATPLIATGWSGNMDFCTPENTWLIRYDMRPIGEGEFLPGSRGAWADVRIHHLAELMRRVVAEPETARAMAEAGRNLVRSLYSPERFDRTILARLEA
ncbi:MAG: hypothetical protein N2588_07735 [Rhodovarius sp.]|nr:hypothetical protein [Rhodovarius sp.]